MQELHLLFVVSITIYLHKTSGQWSGDVLKSGSTCEDKYNYKSCIVSSDCMSNYFLECRCIPRDVKNVLGDNEDGALLCMYSLHVMGTGEPRCCDFYYKRSSFTMTRGAQILKELEDLKDSPYFSIKDKKDGTMITDVLLPGMFESTDPFHNGMKSIPSGTHDVILPNTLSHPETEVARNIARNNMDINVKNMNGRRKNLADTISKYISLGGDADRIYKTTRSRALNQLMGSTSGLTENSIRNRMIEAIKCRDRF